MNRLSGDKVQKNIEKIIDVFPEVVTKVTDQNGKIIKGIDFERLRKILSCKMEDEKERYEFSWIGKKAAILSCLTPAMETLHFCMESSKDWESTENLYIEGDNLEALKLLQKSYQSRVKMIYIDPPYNTGNTYIYRDKYISASNPEFCRHSVWCSMMYPRLKLSYNLLAEDGVIFISIDENEVANLKKICDEIFGESAFVTIITLEITKTQGMKVKSAKTGSIVKNNEFILCYAKDRTNKKIVRHILYDKNEGYDTHFSYYIRQINGDYEIRKLVDVLKDNPDIYAEFKKYHLTGNNGSIRLKDLDAAITLSKKIREAIYNCLAPNIYQEMACGISLNSAILRQLEQKKIVEHGNYLLTRTSQGKVRQFSSLAETLHDNDEYNCEYGRVTIRGNLWKGFYSDMMNVVKEGEIEYKNGKKPVRLIYQLAKWIGVSDGDIVLDFFAGSATTAHAVMKMNAEDEGKRKYILVQLDENLDETLKSTRGLNKKTILKTIDFLDGIGKPHVLSELGKERILRAGEKIKRDLKINGEPVTVDFGYRVFKLRPSNMNNEDLAQTDNKIAAGSKTVSQRERIDLNLLYRAMLESGLPLSLSCTVEEVDGVIIYIVDRGRLIACFSEGLNLKIIRRLAAKRPHMILLKNSVFADSLFRTEVIKTVNSVSDRTVIRFVTNEPDL